MEERTRAYLRGRFGDHYRRHAQSAAGGAGSLDTPPAAEAREWGYIPWTRGPGTTMVRHHALLDLTSGGSLPEFLARERPRHVYFSAGRYDDPGADAMDAKGWRGSDLVFDLDADHLPTADPDDTYGEMLAKCKDALGRLLSFLEEDFGFEDLSVVFSGGRGYHVHVRDSGVLGLDREERREVVDYVRGNGLGEVDALVEERLVSGIGRETPASKRTLRTEGGWGRRTHAHLMAFVDELRRRDADSAKRRLREFEGVGEKTAEKVYSAVRESYDELEAGNIEVRGAATRHLAERFMHEAVREESAPIDEPVTTDINRLIRLPGSLHGGSGLAVRPITRDALDDFDPLVDAVPDTFRGNDIAVEVGEESLVEVGGDSFTLPAGEHTVPEYAGVFLMARGQAEKGKE